MNNLCTYNVFNSVRSVLLSVRRIMFERSLCAIHRLLSVLASQVANQTQNSVCAAPQRLNHHHMIANEF